MSAVIHKWALLKPVKSGPRLDAITILTEEEAAGDLSWIVSERTDNAEVMALDFETKGGDWSSDPSEQFPVGVGLSDSRGSIYIPFSPADSTSLSSTYHHIMTLLMEEQVPLIAHNVFFDAGWPLRDFGYWLNWKACTFSMYKLLATEGWLGQEWGLKAAQKQLLGWAETNETLLDEWLVNNGHISTISKEVKPNWHRHPTLPERWATPRKAEMWRAPREILGHYCALDADSCWQLYWSVLQPAASRPGFEALQDYLANYMTYTEILARQKLRGIAINRAKLVQYREELSDEIVHLKTEFIRLDSVKPHILHWNSLAIDKVAGTEPNRYKQVPALGKEPARYTKKGAESKSWQQWNTKRERQEQTGPELTKTWIAWQARLEEAKGKQHFNLQSGKQLAWLLYERMGYPALIKTETGEPATDEDALLGMGEVGALLLSIGEKEKLVQFCDQTLSLLQWHPSERSEEGGSWKLHPGFMVPGTLTGRLSGKNPNLQQVPKVGRYLECYEPDPGMVFVDCDHSAIEPVVMAELSRDPGLWAVYGPDAKPNDVYLYLGANLPGSIGADIRKTGYDPQNPTGAILSKAKKEAKAARAIAKTVKLACDYGAGPAKLQYTLKVQGISIDMQQANALWESFWDTFKGIRKWKQELERQWSVNRGWVFNGLGRPLGVCEDKKRDLVNRVCQSTGHDIHVKYLLIVQRLLEDAGIPYQWVIADFHDESIIQCKPLDAEKAKYLMGVRAYEILNEWLDGAIPIKGNAEVCMNLAEAKVEGWKSK